MNYVVVIMKKCIKFLFWWYWRSQQWWHWFQPWSSDHELPTGTVSTRRQIHQWKNNKLQLKLLIQITKCRNPNNRSGSKNDKIPYTATISSTTLSNCLNVILPCIAWYCIVLSCIITAEMILSDMGQLKCIFGSQTVGNSNLQPC